MALSLPPLQVKSTFSVTNYAPCLYSTYGDIKQRLMIMINPLVSPCGSPQTIPATLVIWRGTISIMYSEALPQDVGSIEKHIDSALNHLRIYELPLYAAILHTLQMVELRWHAHNVVTQSITAYEAPLLTLKGGLAVLIPKLFEHCDQSKTGQLTS